MDPSGWERSRRGPLRSWMRKILIGIAGAMMVAGCSPALTTMAPAQTARAGHVRASVSADLATTPRDIRTIAGEMQELAEQAPSEFDQGDREEVESLIDDTAAAIVSPPSIGVRAQAAYGITDWLEAGAAVTANTVRGNLRLQLFHLDGPGLFGVANVGAGTYLMGYPIGLATDRVTIDSHSRYDLEASLHVGLSGRVGHVWLG